VAFASGYLLYAGTSPGSNDLLDSIDVGDTTSYNGISWPAESTIYVTIIPYNHSGEASECTEESFATAQAVSVLDQVEDPVFDFFPNPSNCDVKILFTSRPEFSSRLKVFNILGQQISSIKLESMKKEYTWTPKEGFQGLYILLYESDGKVIEWEKGLIIF